MEETASFSNILAVVKFLQARGWKIKKSSAYTHATQGRLRPQKDGRFHQKDIEKYARSYLKQRDPASPVPPELESIQKRRNEAEARKFEAQAIHWEVKSKVESGLYVEKGAFEKALAQRVMLFKSDLDVFAMKEAPDIIRLVDGNDAKVPDLIEYMQARFESFLARYAEDHEFVVPSMPTSVECDDSEGDEKEEDGDIEGRLNNNQENDYCPKSKSNYRVLMKR